MLSGKKGSNFVTHVVNRCNNFKPTNMRTEFIFNFSLSLVYLHYWIININRMIWLKKRNLVALILNANANVKLDQNQCNRHSFYGVPNPLKATLKWFTRWISCIWLHSFLVTKFKFDPINYAVKFIWVLEKKKHTPDINTWIHEWISISLINVKLFAFDLFAYVGWSWRSVRIIKTQHLTTCISLLTRIFQW